MIESICDLLPDPETLLALEPEELAGFVLSFLNSQGENTTALNRYNFAMPSTYDRYPREYLEGVGRALMEAWGWLEREGLLAPRPGTTGDWVFVTRRGKGIKAAADLTAMQKASLLPRAILHPRIATKVFAPFIRGEYDTAIFEAMREVEVAVRAAGRYSDLDVGTKLMRKAFDAKNGVLTDLTLPEPEREAMAHLFAGAMGYFKNQQSHRVVGIKDAAAAVEIIAVASFLLRIVDQRKEAIESQRP
jgi:uncharacterized protein (TIGR02391 family)